MKVVIEDPKTRNAKPIHEAELVFPRGSIQEVKAYQSEDLKIEEFLGVTSDAGHLVVEFSTSGGIGLRLNVRDPRFDTATVNLRGLLEQWTENEPDFHQTHWVTNMRIFVDMSKKDGETNQFFCSLANFEKVASHHWMAYRNNAGTPDIQMGQIFSREKVLEGWTCQVEQVPIELFRLGSGDENSQVDERESYQSGDANQTDTHIVGPEIEHPNDTEFKTDNSQVDKPTSNHDKDDESEAKESDSKETEDDGFGAGPTQDYTPPAIDTSASLMRVEGIVDVLASDTFLDVQEGCIKIFYGASTEERIAELSIQSLQDNTSTVAFTGVDESDGVIQAHTHSLTT